MNLKKLVKMFGLSKKSQATVQEFIADNAIELKHLNDEVVVQSPKKNALITITAMMDVNSLVTVDCITGLYTSYAKKLAPVSGNVIRSEETNPKRVMSDLDRKVGKFIKLDE